MSANTTPASQVSQQTPATSNVAAPETQLAVVPTAPAGESETVAGHELTLVSLGCYRKVVEHLKATNTPQKYITQTMVDNLPVPVAAQLVIELLAKHHTVPTKLAIRAKSVAESKKLVVKARADYKRELQKNSRVLIEKAFAAGFSLTSMSESNTVDSKGRRKLAIAMHTGAGPSKEEIADVVGGLTIEQMEELLAAKKAKSGAVIEV